MVIVVAIPTVDTEVLHSFGAPKNNSEMKHLNPEEGSRLLNKALMFSNTYSTGKSLM